jgi:hypothetical protein
MAPAVAVGALAAGGAAGYYAAQQPEPSAMSREAYENEVVHDDDDDEDYDDEEDLEPVDDEEEIIEDDDYDEVEEEEEEDIPYTAPIATPVPTGAYSPQSYGSQQSPYQQRSRDVEVGEQPRDAAIPENKARGEEESSSSGPTWGCFALCFCLALLLIGVAVFLGIWLSDEDEKVVFRSGPPTATGPPAVSTPLP